MSSKKPAKNYINIVRDFFMLYVEPPNEPWQPHFHAHLEKMWLNMNSQLIELEGANGHPKAIESTRIALYVIAVGLVAYGHLNMIPFMLRNIPTVGKMARLARVALELLPLPLDIRYARDWEQVAKWVEEHENELEWEPDAEKFRIKEPPLVRDAGVAMNQRIRREALAA